jgi:acetyl-CoA acyltransferase 1
VPSANICLQAKKGGFKDTRPEELLSAVLRAAYTKAGVDPNLIEDVAVGNVLPPGGGATGARMAALHAGIPNSAAVNTVNRQCSSGLTAISQIANEITGGQIDIGIGKRLYKYALTFVLTTYDRCWC